MAYNDPFCLVILLKFKFFYPSFQVTLSSPSDGLVHVGDAICLMHAPTQSVVSAYMSAAQAHEAKQLISNCNVACSKRLQPCPRNIFIIGRYNNIISIILYTISYDIEVV